MAVQATCPGCGTRLAYEGEGNATKACPKCQTPVTFSPSVPAQQAVPKQQEIVAELIEPAKPTPAVAAPGTPAKKSSNIWWVLIPVGLAGGGLLMLLVVCAGIGALVISKSGST